MKIISVLGGEGSSFIHTVLERENYRSIFSRLTHDTLKKKLWNCPRLIPYYISFLKTLRCYEDKLRILVRPDAFWTVWRYFEKCDCRPNDGDFQQDLIKQKNYIFKYIHNRSASLPIKRDRISTTSLKELVRTYIEELERIEKENKFKIVLCAAHWGEYGIFKDLNVKTIYVIRDPFNSLISHSKKNRHQRDYLRKGLSNINTKEWINCYLIGPIHYWINHAKTALEHKNAVIVRYNHFKEDWEEKVKDLPNISEHFRFRENKVDEILTKESIDYINSMTAEVCSRLEL